jgi:hypothetical protein
MPSTGELLDIERVTSSSERGYRKSTIRQLADSLLYCKHGSEGGVGKHSVAVRPAPTLQAGWYAVLADPQMPVTSTLLDQAHNAIERKLFAMKGFHHPKGSQQAFLTGLAHLYNLIPYQRRAQHAGQCGVEVEGGKVPTQDWFLNLQLLTSGG